MKDYTSRLLKTTAAFYVSFPVSYIFIIAIVFDIPMNLCLGILLSPFYYLVSLLAVMSGWGLWEMRRWAWYLFVISNVLIGYESAVLVNLYGETNHKFLSFLSVIVFLALVTYTVAKEVRVPYFFPKIRWWESDPRYRLSVPVTVIRFDGMILDGQIMDLSTHGCFVKIRVEVPRDEEVKLKFSVFGYDITCAGNIAWAAPSTVTHPKGIGVKFLTLDRKQKRHLRFITRRLKKIASLYKRSRYLMDQDAYMKRITEIEQTGRSLRAKAEKNQNVKLS